MTAQLWLTVYYTADSIVFKISKNCVDSIFPKSQRLSFSKISKTQFFQNLRLNLLKDWIFQTFGRPAAACRPCAPSRASSGRQLSVTWGQRSPCPWGQRSPRRRPRRLGRVFRKSLFSHFLLEKIQEYKKQLWNTKNVKNVKWLQCNGVFLHNFQHEEKLGGCRESTPLHCSNFTFFLIFSVSELGTFSIFGFFQ